MTSEQTTVRAEASSAAVLSVFDPMFIGIDEFGQSVRLPMIFRNILVGAEPGGGKSNLFLQQVTGHATTDSEMGV